MGSLFEPDASSREREASPQARRREAPTRPEPLIHDLQRSAGNQSVARWLSQTRGPVLQRQLSQAKANTTVKAYVAGMGLVTATVKKTFNVNTRGFGGTVLIRIVEVHDGKAYNAPPKGTVLDVSVAPADLFDEFEEDQTILSSYAAKAQQGEAATGPEPGTTEAESDDESEASDGGPNPLAGQLSQLQKAQREIANKLAGNKDLIQALDELQADRKTKEGERVINGFTVAKKGGDLMVVLFRKMSTAEAEIMAGGKSVSRKEHADPYKWFSESSAHGDGFSSGSDDAVVCKVYINADAYERMRVAVQPEHGATAVSQNRFHQERLGPTSHQINFAVHTAEEDAFNRAIVKIVPAEDGKKLNKRRGAKKKQEVVH